MKTLQQVLSPTRHGPRPRAVIVKGSGPTGDSASRLLRVVCDRYNVIDIVSPGDSSAASESLSLADVVLLDSGVRADEKRRIMQACASKGQEVLLVPDLYDIMLRRARVTRVDDIPLLQIGAGPSPTQLLIKRLLDIVLASVAAVLLLPLFLATMVLVKITSKGPVFYRQDRVGMNGLPFTLIKFRTMVDGAESATGPVFAAADDRRITAIGKPLRSFRLDELPQILNILKGEMSIVGPRPERPSFVNLYSSSVPAYRQRFTVKPGLTGLAQTLGKYTTGPEDKLKYDLIYIQGYSLLLDLWIMVMTIPVLFRPEAARGVIPEAKENEETEEDVEAGTADEDHE